MKISITPEEFKLLRDYIEQECSISLDNDKQYFIESRLSPLVIESGCSHFGAFYTKAKIDQSHALKEKIINAITTNETLWFRDERPFLVLQQQLLPELVTRLESKEKLQIRIWSAASSTGQEAYSIAMTVREFCAHERRATELLKDKLSILATDISSNVLNTAKRGRYNTIAMSRGLSEELKHRYFELEDSEWLLKDEIKCMVNFRQFNLQDSFAALGKFDIIFLRNVAIYFSTEFKKALFQKIYQALVPGGYLFLGGSESLLGYSTDFQPLEHSRYTYYQRKPS